MKALFSISFFLFCFTVSFSQKIYTGINANHYTSQIETCETKHFCDFVDDIGFMYFLPNGQIIGVSGGQPDGRIYEVDTSNCSHNPSYIASFTDSHHPASNNTLDESGNLWMLDWKGLLKYRPQTNDYVDYGNTMPFSGTDLILTYRAGRLIATASFHNQIFLEVDTNNINNNIPFFDYSTYNLWIGPMFSFKTPCEDWITYAVVQDIGINPSIAIRSLIEIDFEQERFYHVCETELQLGGGSQDSIYYNKTCIFEHDLDLDNSSGATASDYKISSCNYDNIRLADDDVILHTNTRIDSMHIYINSGQLDGIDEQLHIANSYGQIVEGNNTADVWIKNIEPYHYAEMEEMMRTILYNNTSTNPQHGEREIYFVVYYRQYESSPAICFLDLLDEGLTAGTDQSISICAPNGAPLEMADYLSIEAIKGGNWQPPTSVMGYLTPGIDSPGNYMYIVQPDNCLPDTAMIEFDIADFVFDLGIDTSICDGNPLDIIAPVPGDYEWSDGSISSSIQVGQSGIYWLEVENSQGCVHRDSIIVDNSISSAMTLLDTFICEGDELNWQGQIYDVDTDYTVYLQNSSGCDSNLQLKLTVVERPIFEIMGDSILCDAADYTLLEVPSTYELYEWSSGEVTPSIEVENEGIYDITVTNSIGCSSVESISVSIVSPLVLSIYSEEPFCSNLDDGWIQIVYESGGVAPFTYTINGTTLTNGLLYENLPSGSYDIEVIDGNGCVWMFEEVLGAGTTHTVSLGDELTIDTVQEVSLEITTDIDPSEIDQIIWMINGDTIVSNQSLLWSAEISQTSIIEILLIDEQGCEYNASQKVILEVNNHVYVPNIFSIDGEIPFMMISSSYSVDVIEELSVYDRWGSEVYSHKNLLPNGDINSWDGTLNGAECEPGIYIYTIRYKVDSETYFKVGDVLLLK